MKKHVARLLRKTAQRIDPQPQPTLWPTTNYTTSSGTTATIVWR